MKPKSTPSVAGVARLVVTFLVATAGGAVLALGLRSVFHDADAPNQGHGNHAAHTGAARADGHHEGPGHAGHAHGGSAAPAAGHDGHASHGSESGEAAADPPAEATGLLLDLGNANCPIMGNEVNGTTYSEWRGLRIGHCCPPCKRDFLEDPEGTLDEAGLKWREAAAAVEKVLSSEGEARSTALAELRARWTVVREPEDTQ